MFKAQTLSERITQAHNERVNLFVNIGKKSMQSNSKSQKGKSSTSPLIDPATGLVSTANLRKRSEGKGQTMKQRFGSPKSNMRQNPKK